MSWLRSHPYIAALLGAMVALSLGALIVSNRSDVGLQTTGLRAWGGVGSDLFDPTARSRAGAKVQRDNIYSQVKSGPPFYYAPGAQNLPLAEDADDLDLNTLLALLAESGKSTSAAPAETPLEAYSFIPQGLISTSTARVKLTPLQRSIFDYGNEAGSIIQSYEERYRAAPQILKDQFEDRKNPAKVAALVSLADALENVGVKLEDVDAPSEIRSAHAKVAASYQELGEKLTLVPQAEGDQAVLEAILAYNAAAEAYVKNFVSLATVISAHGVRFSADDPGTVFTFSQASF